MKMKSCQEREKRLKIKLEEQRIALEKDDNDDVLNLFSKVDGRKDIPEGMQLWEQETKIINTLAPKAYRWHPKLVSYCMKI